MQNFRAAVLRCLSCEFHCIRTDASATKIGYHEQFIDPGILASILEAEVGGQHEVTDGRFSARNNEDATGQWVFKQLAHASPNLFFFTESNGPWVILLQAAHHVQESFDITRLSPSITKFQAFHPLP